MENKLLPKTIEKYQSKLQLVEVSDADFILALRSDISLANHLSKTSPHLSDQIKWIEEYKKREKKGEEFYFIALGPKSEKFGTTRIYNIESDCFEIGSWLFSRNAPLGAAIKADILGREFGFEELGLNYCKFQVRKENSSVLKYHRGYKPDVIGEDHLNWYFQIDKKRFFTHSQKLIKLLS